MEQRAMNPSEDPFIGAWGYTHPSEIEAGACSDACLRYQHNRRLPKRSLLRGWIHHGHLTVISSRRQLVESETEPEWDSFQPRVQSLSHRQRRRFERLHLSAVERHE